MTSNDFQSRSVARAKKFSWNCNQRFLLKLSLPRLSETGLGAGLEQTELGFRQAHFLADLLLALVVQVESRQDFLIALRKTPEDPLHELHLLVEGGALLRVIAPISHPYAQVEI